MPGDEISITQRTTVNFQLFKTNQTAELTVKYNVIVLLTYLCLISWSTFVALKSSFLTTSNPRSYEAQWRSGAVTKWRSDAVAQWRSDEVAKWRSGAVAQ